MNFKHAIIVSLILAILTAGVVSASEDIECNDTLSQNDIADAPISDAPQYSQRSVLQENDDEPVIKADDNDDILGYYSDEDVDVEVYDRLDIAFKYDEIGYVHDYNGLKGTVTLTIDGKKFSAKNSLTGKEIG